MRIETKDTQVCLVLEDTGDIAKLLDVFWYYNSQIPRDSFKPIPRNLMSVLEDEICE
jgi:hypothetical protein